MAPDTQFHLLALAVRVCVVVSFANFAALRAGRAAFWMQEVIRFAFRQLFDANSRQAAQHVQQQIQV